MSRQKKIPTILVLGAQIKSHLTSDRSFGTPPPTHFCASSSLEKLLHQSLSHSTAAAAATKISRKPAHPISGSTFPTAKPAPEQHQAAPLSTPPWPSTAGIFESRARSRVRANTAGNKTNDPKGKKSFSESQILVAFRGGAVALGEQTPKTRPHPPGLTHPYRNAHTPLKPRADGSCRVRLQNLASAAET